MSSDHWTECDSSQGSCVGVEILNMIHDVESRDYPALGEVSLGTHVRRAVALVGLASTEAGEAVGITTPTPGTQLLLEVATFLGRLDTVVKYLDSNILCMFQCHYIDPRQLKSQLVRFSPPGGYVYPTCHPSIPLCPGLAAGNPR